MNIQDVFIQMLILMAAIAVGYLANKTHNMDAEMNRKLSRLVLNITTPAMVLASVMTGEHTLSRSEVLLLLGISVLTYALLIGLSFVLPWLLGVQKKDRGLYRFMTIFNNVCFMGFPVANAVYGPSAVFYVAIFSIPFNILCFTLGVWLVSGKTEDAKFDPKLLLSPTVIASFVALGWYLLDLRAPAALGDCFSFVGQMTTPAAMLIIGSALAMLPLRQVFNDWRIYVFSLIKLLLIPAAVCFCLRRVVSNEMILGITVIQLAMPIATNTTMLCAQYDGDQELAAKGVFLSTLLSVATIPALMAWVL